MGQDLASFIDPFAYRPVSYLIISMATALGLEKDECLGIVAGISWKMMN